MYTTLLAEAASFGAKNTPSRSPELPAPGSGAPEQKALLIAMVTAAFAQLTPPLLECQISPLLPTAIPLSPGADSNAMSLNTIPDVGPAPAANVPSGLRYASRPLVVAYQKRALD